VSQRIADSRTLKNLANQTVLLLSSEKNG